MKSTHVHIHVGTKDAETPEGLSLEIKRTKAQWDKIQTQIKSLKEEGDRLDDKRRSLLGKWMKLTGKNSFTE